MYVALFYIAILYQQGNQSSAKANPLVRVSKVGVLEISQIQQGIIHILASLSLSIAELVATDQHKSQKTGNHGLARSASDDELASGLVDGSLGTEEGVGTDDVADAVGEEDKGRGRGSFGVAGDVGGGHLKSDDEGADEGSGLNS